MDWIQLPHDRGLWWALSGGNVLSSSTKLGTILD